MYSIFEFGKFFLQRYSSFCISWPTGSGKFSCMSIYLPKILLNRGLGVIKGVHHTDSIFWLIRLNIINICSWLEVWLWMYSILVFVEILFYKYIHIRSGFCYLCYTDLTGRIRFLDRNTSLAALGALAHSLQHRTSYKI